MPMPLFLPLLRYNPSFCAAIAEDFEEKRPEDVVHYASNFPTPTLRERLSMPAVAVAVFSQSVSCFILGQLKVYMSAMFENQSKSNSTPKPNAYPSNFRTPTPKERLSMSAVAIAVSSV